MATPQLGFQPLEDVLDVNHFRRVEGWQFTQGDTPTLYLQLLDLKVDAYRRGSGTRYVPSSGSYLLVALHNINDGLLSAPPAVSLASSFGLMTGSAPAKIFRVATQPFPLQDPSIWSFPILSTDVILGTPDILLTLTEFSQGGMASVAGQVALTALGNVITLTPSGGAAFATPLPAVGSQLVIGVESPLYGPNGANGGLYTITASATGAISATKVVDLFYGSLTPPQSLAAAANVVALTDIRVGAGVQVRSALVQQRLRVQGTGYKVPYQSQYTDVVNDNQTGWQA